MILNNGSYNGRQIITPATIDTFTSSPLSAKGIYRGLGFDKRGTASAFGGSGSFAATPDLPERSFGSTGSKKLFMVFLSNSIHPTRTNKTPLGICSCA